MSEHTEPRCCGRPMTSIAVEQANAPLHLHSCPTCGRHAWLSDGAVVDRSHLLAALRVPAGSARPRTPARSSTPRAARGSAPRAVPPAAGPVGEDARREELKALLSRFVVHGTSS